MVLSVEGTESRALVAGVDDWYNAQTLGLDNSKVYWRSIAPKPGTSNFVSQRGGRNDELHVVIVDDAGTLTGIRGNILEKHLNLSKATDAVSEANAPQKTWYKSYLANFSNYIYAGANQGQGNDTFHNTFPVGTYFNKATGANVYDNSDDPTVWYALTQNLSLIHI